MELLQKLTLYDLFGYTLPGVLAVWLFIYDGELAQMDELSLGSLCMLVILGYVAGALITEIAEFVECLLKKLIPEARINKYWKDLCDMYGISVDMVKYALDKAKVTNYNPNDDAAALSKQYATYMYSEIQSDPRYDRLDTYASAELLYKNMCIVSLCAIGMGILRQQNMQIIISAAGAIFFAARRVRFAERSRGYTICWFIQKYGGQ